MMSISPPIITLLTDFGENDGYVSAMKGVMLTIAPTAHLIDISHQIAPQNIHQAALLLDSVFPYFPSTAVHMIVVDPGVGGERRAIAVETPHGWFVAPDNGVLTAIFRREAAFAAVVLENKDYWLPSPSMTFHGRDIFSPVAAHLAQGVRLSDLGPICANVTQIDLAEPTVTPDGIQGQVIHIDHFGNIITNIGKLVWASETHLATVPLFGEEPSEVLADFSGQNVTVQLGEIGIKGIHRTYSGVQKGQTLALVNSSGLLEIAINQGHAGEIFKARVGDPVKLCFDH